jgi:hypothetical protein
VSKVFNTFHIRWMGKGTTFLLVDQNGVIVAASRDADEISLWLSEIQEVGAAEWFKSQG